VLEAQPLETTLATDEVIDAIAGIEMQRRETEREAGLAMSCSSALHRLNELLDHETEALRLRGPDAGHPKNVEAVKLEIGRVKGLAVVANQRPNARNRYPDQRSPSWQNAPQNPGRNRGRRTMGRAGGR
jgi:hypothetical protein